MTTAFLGGWLAWGACVRCTVCVCPCAVGADGEIDQKELLEGFKRLRLAHSAKVRRVPACASACRAVASGRLTSCPCRTCTAAVLRCAVLCCAVFLRCHSPQDITAFMDSSDANKDGRVSAEEFAVFARRQHVALQAVFDTIDVKRTGRVTEADLRQARDALGLTLTDADVHALLADADRDKSGAVTFEEFAELLFFARDVHMRGVFDQWASHALLESSEYAPPVEVERKLPTWALLVSGAIAGAVSRTATAPLDRLKTLMQAQTTGGASLLAGVRSIAQEGGWRAFFRGNGVNVIKVRGCG